MQLSTFRTSLGYNKAKEQHWRFALFLTAEISPVKSSVYHNMVFLPCLLSGSDWPIIGIGIGPIFAISVDNRYR